MQTRQSNFADRINGALIVIWSSTRNFGIVTKAQTSLSLFQCALVTSQCDKCPNLVLAQMAISVLFVWEDNALANRLAWAFVTLQTYHVLAQVSICLPEVKALVSVELTHLYRLAWSFVTVSESSVQARLAVYVTFMRAAKALVSQHICTGSPVPFVTRQIDTYWILMPAQMAMSVPYMKEAHAPTGSSELFVTIP